MNQETIKPAQTKLSLAFSVFTGALCETALVLFGVVCQYLITQKWRASNNKLLECAFMNKNCLRYLTGGDTHVLCVACLGEEHARSVLENAGCEHCNVLPL